MTCPASVLPWIHPALHFSCPASKMSCLRPVLRPSCNESDLQSIACVLSFNSHILLQNCIWPVLPQFCPASHLSCILTLLPLTFPASILSCILPALAFDLSWICPVLHLSCPASPCLASIRFVLHPSGPLSYCTALHPFYIWSVLHQFCPGFILSCIRPVLVQHPSYPASTLSCIRPVLHLICPVSDMSCLSFTVLYCRFEDECRHHFWNFSKSFSSRVMMSL